MKTAFTPGVKVRILGRHERAAGGPGVIGEITNYRKSWDWRIPGYLGNGFYSVLVDGRELVISEDDMSLAA